MTGMRNALPFQTMARLVSSVTIWPDAAYNCTPGAAASRSTNERPLSEAMSAVTPGMVTAMVVTLVLAGMVTDASVAALRVAVKAQVRSSGVTVTVPEAANAPVVQNRTRTVPVVASTDSTVGTRVPSSAALPSPEPPRLISGARSRMDARSMVRPLPTVKSTSMKVSQGRLLTTAMSTVPPGPGSTTTALTPVTVNDTVVAALPAPTVVPEVVVTSRFLTPPAVNTSATVPSGSCAEPMA